MTASETLYHEIHARMWSAMRPAGVRATTITRLALLVVGLVLSRGVVGRQIAVAMRALPWGVAVQAAAIRRRVQRTLADPALQAATGYGVAVAAVVPWECVRSGRGVVVLIVDDTSQRDRVHELRLALAYRGTALPLAWQTWEQNAVQPDGAYWKALDDVLTAAAAIVPPDLPVVVLADRAFDVPAFVDRVSAHGWHWVVRAKIRGSTRFRDARGESTVGGLVARRLGPRRGARCKTTGHVFKHAGWRPASMVMLRGADGPLALLSDLPARWALIALYRQRFWIETSFRNAKTLGWRWEDTQVRDPAAHATLLLAMAWATLITLCVGAASAEIALLTLCTAAAPQHARDSLFTQGRRRLQHLLLTAGVTVLPWRLPDLLASTWDASWRAAQARNHIFGIKSVTP
jgi:hypothetical protein